MNKQRDKRYENLDGLRTISCFAIIAMHIKENTNYSISGFFYNTFIPSWTLLVYLFLMISAFGMCCGYYKKMIDGNIDIQQFYLKRYKKILPFFALLIFIDVIIERHIKSIYEAFIELTLMFGFLPNNELSVIGVSWTIGVIFVFYFIFPFFVFLIANKRRSILVFITSIIINYLCSIYFFSSQFVLPTFSFRHSFIYCLPFFLAGGVLYKFKDEISKLVYQHQTKMLLISILLTALYYIIPNQIEGINIFTLKILVVFMSWFTYAISVKSSVLANKFMKYFSGISMEMYLAHMFVFRCLEKFNILYVFGYSWISYILIFILVIIGLVIFIEIYKQTIRIFQKKILK